MNKIINQICFVLILLNAGTLIMKGQQTGPLQTGQKVVLFSDRNLYIAGEEILFSAFLHLVTGSEPEGQSRILYCELIGPDGIKYSGNKYLIENSSASGYFPIPNDITTGIYFLRAYTKSMRNNGPSDYNYTQIKIVNPNRNEVQSITSNDYSPDTMSVDENSVKPDSFFLISTDKSQYAPGDKVSISIEGKKTIPSSWKGLTLAVVPEYSASEAYSKFSADTQPDKNTFYFPENRGLSLTGKLTDNKTGKPLPHSRINLSIIGRGRDFMAVNTDTAGRFFFSLPEYTGSRDLFLCSDNTATSDPKILVDNDFCNIPVHIPSNNFTLTSRERDLAYKMAVNVQVGSYFRTDSIPVASNIYEAESQTFYGRPVETLYLDDYVQLPTLEEYFNSLPSYVKVRKRQGEKYFKVLGTQTGLTDIDPLVLVDLVAISDQLRVLAIQPVNISRIEVVNSIYVKGDQTYGGIINIVSKHGDFAGIDLPSSGVFISFRFLNRGDHYPGDYHTLPHTPDARNTLYWEPRLRLNKDNSAGISFTASDTPGRYQIILNGITSDGKTFRQSGTFEIGAKYPLK